jgi:hypothetical protein
LVYGYYIHYNFYWSVAYAVSGHIPWLDLLTGCEMPQTLRAAIYDIKTLAPRTWVVPHDDSHLDGRHVGPGQAMAIIQANQVAGLDVTEAAYKAIRLRTGREPPPMDQVRAADASMRGLFGG